MHNTLPLIGGVTVGAGLMFILDPDRGRRRRALMRDKSIRWSRKTREFAGSASRDVRNRFEGCAEPRNRDGRNVEVLDATGTACA